MDVERELPDDFWQIITSRGVVDISEADYRNLRGIMDEVTWFECDSIYGEESMIRISAIEIMQRTTRETRQAYNDSVALHRKQNRESTQFPEEQIDD